MTWGKPRAEDGRAYVGTRAPTCYSSSSLGLAVKSPWPRKPQARAHRPRRSCLLVSSLRMRSTAVGVRMRAALPRARACAHGIFVSRRWRGSAPLNVGLLNAFGRPLCGGSVHDKFHQGDPLGFTTRFTAGRELRRSHSPTRSSANVQWCALTAASARLGLQAPHARSCSAHSHSDHYATCAQAAHQWS